MEQTFISYSEEDRAEAEACSALRLADASKVKARDRFGEDSPQSHYFGALGEIAVARALGIPWRCHSKRWNLPDVGPYEVRAVGPGTKPYVKTKGNDRLDVPIVVVLLCTSPGVNRAVTSAIIAGTIMPMKLRAVGQRSDPGGRGAPAHFASLADLTPW